MNAPPRRKRLEKRELSMPRTSEPYQMIERSIIKKVDEAVEVKSKEILTV